MKLAELPASPSREARPSGCEAALDFRPDFSLHLGPARYGRAC